MRPVNYFPPSERRVQEGEETHKKLGMLIALGLIVERSGWRDVAVVRSREGAGLHHGRLHVVDWLGLVRVGHDGRGVGLVLVEGIAAVYAVVSGGGGRGVGFFLRRPLFPRDFLSSPFVLVLGVPAALAGARAADLAGAALAVVGVRAGAPLTAARRPLEGHPTRLLRLLLLGSVVLFSLLMIHCWVAFGWNS